MGPGSFIRIDISHNAGLQIRHYHSEYTVRPEHGIDVFESFAHVLQWHMLQHVRTVYSICGSYRAEWSFDDITIVDTRRESLHILRVQIADKRESLKTKRG